jgi:anti-sigma factor RsiW
MNERLRELLHRSLDSGLSPEEERVLADGLESSPELREEKLRIEKIRGTLAGCGADGFGPLFVKRVMERVEAADLMACNALERVSLMFGDMFRQVALIGGAAVLIMIVINLTGGDTISLAGALGLSHETGGGVWRTPLEFLFRGIL